MSSNEANTTSVVVSLLGPHDHGPQNAHAANNCSSLPTHSRLHTSTTAELDESLDYSASTFFNAIKIVVDCRDHLIIPSTDGVLLHKKALLGSRCDCRLLPILRVKSAAEASIWGVKRHFQAKVFKYQHLHIIETTASIPTKLNFAQ